MAVLLDPTQPTPDQDRHLTRFLRGQGRLAWVQGWAADQMAGLYWAARRIGLGLFPLDPAVDPGRMAALAGADSLDQPRPRETRCDPALVVATSGSSGQPKAVMLSDANLRASAAAAQDRLGLGGDDCWLLAVPLFHMAGLAILERAWATGARVVVMDGFDAVAALETMRRHKVTHLSVVPTMLDRLLAAGPPPLSVKLVLVGGAALPADLARRALAAGWPIRATYGASETASMVATQAQPPDQWIDGMAGKPVQGAHIRIDDQGRLCIQGPMVMLGYANPCRVPGQGLSDGWWMTQDRGMMDLDGGLIVAGRLDQVIITGGRKLDPVQVEQALRACPGVTGILVTGVTDPIWGQVVGAAVMGIGGRDLMRWAADHLPAHWRPRHVLDVPELPLTASGKPDRAGLSRRLQAQAGT